MSIMISSSKDGASFGTSTTDPRRELVERIIASPLFSKSERISSLLVYICEIALGGREGEISEQKIGAALFGRSADYDSSIDGIVRTQASRLRQKLDLYFEGEGVDEPVRIVIPKGGYVPFFVPRPPKDAVLAITLPTPIPSPAISSEDAKSYARHFGKPILAWSLVFIFALVILGMFLLNRRAFAKRSTTQPLLSEMFRADQQTLVITGDSGLVMWHGITGRKLDLSEYIAGTFRAEQATTATPSSAQAADLSSRRYTSNVDLEIVHALGLSTERSTRQFIVRYARDVRPNDLKEGNVILLGATEANPWVEMFEPRMNFTFSNDRVHQIMSVLNRLPKNNEPLRWDSDYADPQHRVYGVVAFLSNLSGNGNALILEGTSMAGTESAWDFVSDDPQLLLFLNHIRRPDGSLPHFEVVLGTNNVSGSAAKASILAWRTSN
jgi:hypothetical protein